MKDILNIIGKIKCPNDEYIAVLEDIRDRYKSPVLITISAFNYGIMIGKREERARRKGGRA